MKISPIAQGGSVPQANLDTNIATSPDRKAAAIAAFKGEGTIVESDTPVDPQVARAQANIRKIRMKTNYSTDRIEEPTSTDIVQPENVQDPLPDNGIPNDSSDAEPVTEVTKPLSPQFAALARQKRALQVKEGELRQREAALVAQGQTTGGYTKEQLQANALGILQEAGVMGPEFYNKLTEHLLANPNQNNSDLQAIRDELRATKEEFSKTLSERDAQTEREALREIQRNVDQLVANGDDFEMIRETGSQRDVTALVKEIWKTEGIIMDETEAAALVENELLNEAEKIARIKKLQTRLAPAQSVPAQQAQAQQPRQMRTLTNRDGTTPAMSRRERAIRAALGQK